MTKHKLIAEKSFLYEGTMMEVGQEFTVNASEVSEYVNNGLAKESTTASKTATRKSKVADTEFAEEQGTVDRIVSKNAPQTNVTDSEFANDLTANANQDLASQQANKTAQKNSFTGMNQENQ